MRVGEVDRQPLEADDVHYRMRRREERDLASELAERSFGIARALGSAPPLPFQQKQRTVESIAARCP